MFIPRIPILCLLILIGIEMIRTHAKPIKPSQRKEKIQRPIIINNVIDIPKNATKRSIMELRSNIKDLNMFTNDLSSGNYRLGVWLCTEHGLDRIVGLETTESAENVNNQIQSSIVITSESNESNLIFGLEESLLILKNLRDHDDSLLFNFFFVGKSLRKENWSKLNSMYSGFRAIRNSLTFFVDISGSEEIKEEFRRNGRIIFDLRDLNILMATIEFLYEEWKGFS